MIFYLVIVTSLSSVYLDQLTTHKHLMKTENLRNAFIKQEKRKELTPSNILDKYEEILKNTYCT